jgi:hypothetical protein
VIDVQMYVCAKAVVETVLVTCQDRGLIEPEVVAEGREHEERVGTVWLHRENEKVRCRVRDLHRHRISRHAVVAWRGEEKALVHAWEWQ